jgi:hypothetical protein
VIVWRQLRNAIRRCSCGNRLGDRSMVCTINGNTMKCGCCGREPDEAVPIKNQDERDTQ